jgi:tetratricopeptide (TPR) repeat protein
MTHRRHHQRRRFRRDSYLARPPATEGAGPRSEGRPLPFEFADTEGRAEPGPSAPAAPAAPRNGKASSHENGGSLAAIYQELLAADPEQVAARGHLALVLERLGEHETALAELDLCVDRAPEDARALLARAAVRAALSRLPEAEADIRRALRAEPASPDAHVALGVLLSRRALWREAIPPLRRAVELDPGRASAWDHLGEALNHVDDLDGALQAFHRSTELRPNGARALRGLGIVYDRLNRPVEAAQMYRRARELAGT